MTSSQHSFLVPNRSACCILLLLFITAGTAQAHGPKFTHLATSAVIAEDALSAWTADDVATGKYDSLFSPITEAVSNLNFTTSTYWVKFNVVNGRQMPSDFYIETARPLTNLVNFYRIGKDTTHLLYRAGDELPFTERPVTYRKFVFPLRLQSLDTVNIMLQLKSDGEVLNLPIKLWEPENFHGFIQRENLTLGIYYGLLLFVAGLFLFFAFVVKQKIYTYYVSYVVFLFFMQASLDGLAFEYLWPQSPWIANHSILFFSGASVFMIMLYAAEFLQIRFMPTWYTRLYRGLLVLVSLCIIGSLMSGKIYELTFPVINGLSLVSLLVIIAGIAWNHRVNKNVNVFFALGFISVLAGGIVFILTNFNLIYSDFLSQNAIKLGSAAEVSFLSLAMVSRYRDIQREKEEARREAFENLEKLNEVTRQQNVMLEQQVAARTAEIREKSMELEVKNQEIIDSITYARRIQEAILPPEKLFNASIGDGFVFYLPKDIVAGDFYWLEPCADGVFIAAADCTGHGVPGAMVSVVCHNALNRSVREFQRNSPAAVLDMTASIVDETFEKSEEEVKDGMDISLLKLHHNTSEIEWAGANNPLYLVSDKQYDDRLGEPAITEEGLRLYEIKADKQPIGRHHGRKNYSNHHLVLSPGDMLYLFSDGFPDQFGGAEGKKYKSRNFKKFLLSINAGTPGKQKALLRDEFKRWSMGHEQVDDVCVIGVRLT